MRKPLGNMFRSRRSALITSRRQGGGGDTTSRFNIRPNLGRCRNAKRAVLHRVKIYSPESLGRRTNTPAAGSTIAATTIRATANACAICSGRVCPNIQLRGGAHAVGDSAQLHGGYLRLITPSPFKHGARMALPASRRRTKRSRRLGASAARRRPVAVGPRPAAVGWGDRALWSRPMWAARLSSWL